LQRDLQLIKSHKYQMFCSKRKC